MGPQSWQRPLAMESQNRSWQLCGCEVTTSIMTTRWTMNHIDHGNVLWQCGHSIDQDSAMVHGVSSPHLGGNALCAMEFRHRIYHGNAMRHRIDRGNALWAMESSPHRSWQSSMHGVSSPHRSNALWLAMASSHRPCTRTICGLWSLNTASIMTTLYGRGHIDHSLTASIMATMDHGVSIMATLSGPCGLKTASIIYGWLMCHLKMSF